MGISPFVQWSAAPLPSLGSSLSLHQAPPFLSELHLIRTCHPGYSYHHPAYPSSNTQKHTHRALVHYGLHALTCSYICIAWAHYIMTLPWVQPSHPSYGEMQTGQSRGLPGQAKHTVILTHGPLQYPWRLSEVALKVACEQDSGEDSTDTFRLVVPDRSSLLALVGSLSSGGNPEEKSVLECRWVLPRLPPSPKNWE